MRQRVIVALATFLHPRVILADEPTTALDVVVQRGIITMLGELQARERNTLVVVSHDMGVHYQLAYRLAIIYAGKLVELADMSALVDRPLHPYTALLIGVAPARRRPRAARGHRAAGRRASLDPPPGCRFAAALPAEAQADLPVQHLAGRSSCAPPTAHRRRATSAHAPRADPRRPAALDAGSSATAALFGGTRLHGARRRLAARSTAAAASLTRSSANPAAARPRSPA